MRNVACATLLLFLCGPLFGQQISELTHAAAYVELPSATLDELARRPAVSPIAGHEQRSRPHFAPRRAQAGAVIADFAPAPNAAAVPPPVTHGFLSSFDPLPGVGPSDPADAAGAVGPHHVLGMFNNGLTVQDRDGNSRSLLTLHQFWQEALTSETAIYDPRVVYDAVSDRWAVAMLADTTDRLGVLFLATTTSGDPTGAWRRFRVAAGSNPDYTLDFTRMALTSDQIVITANVFSALSLPGVDIFLFPKSAVFSAGPAVFAVTRALAANAFDLTPVTSPDTTIRILGQDSGGSIFQFIFDSTNLHYGNRYDPPAGFTLDFRTCSQLGTTVTVDCDNSWLSGALFRGGVLWVVHSASEGSRGIVVVWKITGDAAKVFVLRDDAADYGYPSIAVNRFGAALVGFSTFGASIYPSAGYRYIDPNGNVSDAGVVKNGEDWYEKVRWGDYSTTVVDPADDTSFWTLQSYARLPLGVNHITWGTWWSYVQVHGPRVRAVRHP